MKTRLLASLIVLLFAQGAQATLIWVEGEKPARSDVRRHPYWYDLVKRDQLSGGDFISNWSETAGTASYRVTVPQAGEFEFWVRANPVQTKLSFMLGDGAWTEIKTDRDAVDVVNIAADDKPDLRFVAWIRVGKVKLEKGVNRVSFRMNSGNNNHGYLDCFVFTDESFQPRGPNKPGAASVSDEAGWFAFDPKPDTFKADNAIDLRRLNEKFAGENGRIIAKGPQFVHERSGKPVRFWAVNGPSSHDPDALKREARILAKRGVNLVRIHHAYYDRNGVLDLKKVAETVEAVEILKNEGIYTHLSIYFPLWLDPEPGNRFLKGYDGKTHPFAALYFNEDFQAVYKAWWQALLTTKNPRTGKTLLEEPAVFGVEIINEDSYFFWTFNDKNIPDPQLRLLETQFGAWLGKKYGSINAAFTKWNGPKLPRDVPAEGRVGFRPLWNIANEKQPRDKDAAAFLLQSQRGFYEKTYAYLHSLGFKGLVTASNWATASPEVLGPLEKYSYTATDFIDRHGYFGGKVRGEASEWSIRDGHFYTDRSALRFDSETPGKPKVFVHPAMDPKYDNKPSMISETTWNRPNRYRTEAPLYFAVYGALQDSDAIVHFADDGANWSVKPGYFMQPWTLMAPSQMGQFPAAALIYRQGLVDKGDVLVDLNLKLGDLLDLKGTPLPQDAALDELRLKDVTSSGGRASQTPRLIDPLVHYVGQTKVTFSERGGPSTVKPLAPFVDRKRQVVTSTNKQLRLDYGKGKLEINAPSVQGVSGNIAGTTALNDLVVTSKLELAHIVVVSLDGQPLAKSQKMLLQVMTEEKPSGFKTESAGDEKRIVSIGRDPWLVKNAEGTVAFKRSDASRLKVTALDGNGDPMKTAGDASKITLQPSVVYYLIAL